MVSAKRDLVSGYKPKSRSIAVSTDTTDFTLVQIVKTVPKPGGDQAYLPAGRYYNLRGKDTASRYTAVSQCCVCNMPILPSTPTNLITRSEVPMTRSGTRTNMNHTIPTHQTMGVTKFSIPYNVVRSRRLLQLIEISPRRCLPSYTRVPRTQRNHTSSHRK